MLVLTKRRLKIITQLVETWAICVYGAATPVTKTKAMRDLTVCEDVMRGLLRSLVVH